MTGRGGGYPFEQGHDYLVYGYRSDDRVWSTDICTRTNKAAKAAEDLSLLAELPPQARSIVQDVHFAL